MTEILTMKKAESLPFSLETESVSSWLSQLSELDAISSGMELYAVLKILYRIGIGDSDLLSTLDLLSPSTLHVSDKLYSLLVPAIAAEGSVNPKSRKIARLGSQLLRSHCLAYCHAAIDQPLTQDRKAHAIYSGLQLAGLTMRMNTLISERQSMTLWQKTAELYRIAVEEKLFHSAISTKFQAFKPLQSIVLVLQRNLLFALFEPYPASPERISWYYNLAGKCAELIKIENTFDSTNTYFWDTCENKPRKILPNDPEGTGLVFDIEAVSRHLLEIAPEIEAHDGYFFKLRQKLNGHQEILDSIMLSKPKAHYFAIGLTAISASLKRLERIFKINRISGQPAPAASIRDLELAPLDSDFKSASPQHMNLSQRPGKSIVTDRIHLQQAKIPNYYLGQAKQDGIATGQPIIIYNEQTKPKLGIIRESFSNTSPSQQVLIETIPGEPKSISIQSLSNHFEAITIEVPNKDSSAFLPPGKYSTGDQLIRSDRPESRYFLKKLIEENDHFMHYRIVSDY